MTIPVWVTSSLKPGYLLIAHLVTEALLSNNSYAGFQSKTYLAVDTQTDIAHLDKRLRSGRTQVE